MAKGEKKKARSSRAKKSGKWTRQHQRTERNKFRAAVRREKKFARLAKKREAN